MKLYLRLIYRYYRYTKKIANTLIFSVKALFKYYAPSKNIKNSEQLKKLFKKIDIEIDTKGFIYFVDIYKTIERKKRTIDNITIDYDFVLKNSLRDLQEKAEKIKDNDFRIELIQTIKAIEILIDRIQSKTNSHYVKFIENIKDKRVTSFEEALQRILFFNQLLWQTNHNLNGLGRLDLILESYYNNDLKNGKINYEKAKKLVIDFCEKLNKYYWVKSNGLVGDTGQVIILGGLKKDGKYLYNDLTKLFLEVVKDLRKPDPKTILRVSYNMPEEILDLALESIKTGIGSPLLSNDDVIIPKMINFKYEKEDAYNYCTSACWEPYVPGVSFDQNNVDTFVYVEPLNKLLDNENLFAIHDYEELYRKYEIYLERAIIDFIEKVNQLNFAIDPLISLISKSCYQKGKDLGNGGAKYNHYGITTVSMSNVVNSLLIIKKYCFEEKLLTLTEINKIRRENYTLENYDKKFKNEKKKYGSDDEEVIDLTRKISQKASSIFMHYKNNLGGYFKIGLSSPSYITKSKFPATLDGRKANEPFDVHISNEKASYTEVINFASTMDYGDNRINGNVVDIMMNPIYLTNNLEKVKKLLLVGIKKGFYQLQMNVVSSKMLIEAKSFPEKYKNLIVRVWGFSAYFNDLPMSYKNLLIERALENESKN